MSLDPTLCSGRMLNFSEQSCLMASGWVWSVEDTGRLEVEEQWDEGIYFQLCPSRDRKCWLSLWEIQLLSGSHSLLLALQPGVLTALHHQQLWVTARVPVGFSLSPAHIFADVYLLLDSPPITHSEYVIFSWWIHRWTEKVWTVIRVSQGAGKAQEKRIRGDRIIF